MFQSQQSGFEKELPGILDGTTATATDGGTHGHLEDLTPQPVKASLFNETL